MHVKQIVFKRKLFYMVIKKQNIASFVSGRKLCDVHV